MAALAFLEWGLYREDLASDAGLVTAVANSPAILLQLDEFGRWLRTIGDARRNPHQFATVSTLLKFYSCAGAIFRGKAYADANKNPVIEQPCVSLLATTAPEHFRQALSPESVADGFLARLMVFEAGDLPPRVWAKTAPVPANLISYAEYWKQFQPNAWHPVWVPEPSVILTTSAAQHVFEELANRIDRRIAEDREDQRAIWARTEEKACRLALIYACSRDPANLVIDEEASRWACELATYLTRRMLWIIHEHVAQGEFDAKQKKVMRFVRDNGGSMSQTEYCRITQHMSIRERHELMDNLMATLQLKKVTVRKKGRPKTVYKVL